MRHTILFLVRRRTLQKELLPGLQQHYDVVTEDTRRDAIQRLVDGGIDVVVMDLPSLRFDPHRFCEDVRAQDPGLPFLFLLSKGMRLDQLPRANGYVRHPCGHRQVLRRLARILPEHQGETASWKGLQLDTERYILMWQEEQVALTPKQAGLALAFLRSPETLLSRAALMQEVWGTDYMGDTRTLDVHIHWLRKALETLHTPFVLETQRGKGYKLVALAIKPR